MGNKTLTEIRSEACNKLLVVLALAAIPAVVLSLSRAFEQGWKPVMWLHLAMLAVFICLMVWRHRLSLAIRAGATSAALFFVGVGGLITYRTGTGVVMFFVSSSVFAACFFGQRIAFAVAALSVMTLLLVLLGFKSGFIGQPVNPSVYVMDITGWLTVGVALLIAAGIPIVVLSSISRALET